MFALGSFGFCLVFTSLVFSAASFDSTKEAVPLDLFVETKWNDGNNTNTSCVWSAWTKCSRSCGGGLQERVQTCEDDDDDHEGSKENRACSTQACEAAPSRDPITYIGDNVLGQWFTVELDRAKAPQGLLDMANVVVALLRIGSQPVTSSTEHRQLREADVCTEVFNRATSTFQATADTSNHWVTTLMSEQAGLFTCCLKASNGLVAAFGEPLVVRGPSHVAVSGAQCDANSEPIEVPRASTVDLQVAGISLNPADSWGLVPETDPCPPPQGAVVRGVSTSRATTWQPVTVPGNGRLDLCYEYAGTWYKLPTCARAVATGTTTTTASSESTTWAIIGSVLAVLGALALAAVWGFLVYRRRATSKMEVMFNIVPSDDNDNFNVGACVTPMKTLDHSDDSSRYVSPSRLSLSTVTKAPPASPSGRQPSHLTVPSASTSPFCLRGRGCTDLDVSSCATPMKTLEHSNAGSRQSSALRSRYVSPTGFKNLSVFAKAPPVSPSGRRPVGLTVPSAPTSPFHSRAPPVSPSGRRNAGMTIPSASTSPFRARSCAHTDEEMY